jgi:hypothetical protein
MILLDDKIFIHIPKTSGTNFRNNVINTYSSNDYSNYSFGDNQFGNLNSNEIDRVKQISTETIDDISIKHKEEYICIPKSEISKVYYYHIKHLPLNVWEKYSIYKNQSVFTIVRNPYTKFISHYENTIDNLKLFFNFDKPTLKKFIYSENINSIVSKIGGEDYKLNQVDYLTNTSGDIVCDKFYKMETDQENISIDFDLPNLNKLKINQKNYNRDYSNLYDDELINWVQETYKRDFEYFSYDINPFWK